MITFFLAQPQRETSAINILVSVKGVKYRRSIGESTPVKLWNKLKKRVKAVSEYKEANGINDQIMKWEKAAIDTVAYFKDYYDAPEKDVFFKILDVNFYGSEKQEKVLYFLEYMQIYIDRYFESRKSTRIQRYIIVKNKLEEYQKDKKVKLSFGDIDIMFYNSFKQWFLAKGLSLNYFGSIVKIIKLVYTEAQNVDGLHSFNKIKHKDFISTAEDVENIYLDLSELKLIYEYELTEQVIEDFYKDGDTELDSGQIKRRLDSYRMIRDRFLIGAYTGLRVSDFGRLHEANIGEKFIRLRAKKTDKETVIPINSIVRSIIERNDLSKTVSDQKINKHIKEICKMVGITGDVLINKSNQGVREEIIYKKYELVTTHTARRSFATNAYKSGVPTIAIMKITGHTKESTFLKYIKVSAEENAELLLLHNFFK